MWTCDYCLVIGSYVSGSKGNTKVYSTRYGFCFVLPYFVVVIFSVVRGIDVIINTLRPRQNGRHFADNIFKCIFLNESVWIPIKISLQFVPRGPINNIPALVQIMAWRRPGDKPLSEAMMVSIPMHICVIRPQWVKSPGILGWLNVFVPVHTLPDLDLEFSRWFREFAISQPKIVSLPQNKKQTHRLNSTHQIWPSSLTLVMTLTLNSEGQIWNSLYLSQKCSDCHKTKSKHINWTLGLICDHKVWPWPWIFKVNYLICYMLWQNDLIATKWKLNVSIEHWASM